MPATWAASSRTFQIFQDIHKTGDLKGLSNCGSGGRSNTSTSLSCGRCRQRAVVLRARPLYWLGGRLVARSRVACEWVSMCAPVRLRHEGKRLRLGDDDRLGLGGVLLPVAVADLVVPVLPIGAGTAWLRRRGHLRLTHQAALAGRCRARVLAVGWCFCGLWRSTWASA